MARLAGGEITLATMQVTAAVQVLGAGSIEAKRAFQRAPQLIEDASSSRVITIKASGLLSVAPWGSVSAA